MTSNVCDVCSTCRPSAISWLSFPLLHALATQLWSEEVEKVSPSILSFWWNFLCLAFGIKLAEICGQNLWQMTKTCHLIMLHTFIFVMNGHIWASLFLKATQVPFYWSACDNDCARFQLDMQMLTKNNMNDCSCLCSKFPLSWVRLGMKTS